MINLKIWSDFACPYCYIGKRKLESAVNELNIKNSVDIVHKSFQLDLQAKRIAGVAYAELIAQKYSIPYSGAKESVQALIDTAKDAGINMDLDNAVHNKTQDAHRLAKYAKTQNKENNMIDRLFLAYFEENMDIGNKETLISLSEEIGLDGEAVKKMLNDTMFVSDVYKDQLESSNYNITSVPFYIFNEEYIVNGALPVNEFIRVIKLCLK